MYDIRLMHACHTTHVFSYHSFIYSDHFYSASSSPLLLRSGPDTTRILGRSLTPKRHRQLRVKDLLKIPVYVAAKAGFEPTTLRLKGFDTTNAPPRPTTFHAWHKFHA